MPLAAIIPATGKGAADITGARSASFGKNNRFAITKPDGRLISKPLKNVGHKSPDNIIDRALVGRFR